MVDTVTLQLQKSEAIVFFELLSRCNDEKTLTIAHPAEAKVLSHMLCLLEKTLVEPFDKNYLELLEHARRNV